MIQNILTSALRGALRNIGVDPLPERIPLERSNRPEHGDWSSSVALAVAKASGRTPRDIADAVAARLTAEPPAYVSEVTVAGPGFVNFRLHDRWLHDVLTQILEQGVDSYARHAIGGGERVNVEFVSANPTGPLHVGAGRWAVYGDALCRIMQRCGYDVHREYYVNDRGVQMALFVASLAAAKAGRPIPDEGYKGQYVLDWAEEMPDDADPAAWAHGRVLADIGGALSRVGVEFDTWFSETSMVASGAIDTALADLRAHGHVFEADGATWLRTTELGLAKDEVLLKTGGAATYLLGDIAYHRDKFARGFNRLIDVWGADHHGHVARLKAGVAALGHDPEALEIVLGQLVSVERDGEVVRMGKRSGEFVELAEVVDEIGPDVARLTFLLQSIDTRQTFDLDAVVAKSMDNPVFYVQYAHARIASMARVAAERGVQRYPLEIVDLSVLSHARELDLLRSLAELPEVVLDACTTRGPHKVATWVRELAGRFHGFYHDCYVMGDGVSHELTQARLWLVEGTRVGLAIGLDLLGVSAPDSM